MGVVDLGKIRGNISGNDGAGGECLMNGPAIDGSLVHKLRYNGS